MVTRVDEQPSPGMPWLGASGLLMTPGPLFPVRGLKSKHLFHIESYGEDYRQGKAAIVKENAV